MLKLCCTLWEAIKTVLILDKVYEFIKKRRQIRWIQRRIKYLGDEIKYRLFLWKIIYKSPSSSNLPEFSEPRDHGNQFIYDKDNETTEIGKKIFQELQSLKYCYILSSPENKINEILDAIKRENRLQDSSRKFEIATIEPEIFHNYSTDNQTLYNKIINYINESFNLKYSSTEWIRDNPSLKNNPDLLLKQYIDQIIIGDQYNRNFVIIIKDIKNIFNLFSNRTNFFSIIDFCYSQRAINQNYKKLNFLLFGSAYPNKSNNTTNNIGDMLIDNTYDMMTNQREAITVGWFVDKENIISPIITIIKTPQSPHFWNDINGQEINIQYMLFEIWKSTAGHPLWTQEIFQQLIDNKSRIEPGEEALFLRQQVARLTIKATVNSEN